MPFSEKLYKNPPKVLSRISKKRWYHCFEFVCSSTVSGLLPMGIARLGVRWKTFTEPAMGPHS